MQQALPAIILAVLRRFRGPAVFRGLRPCSSPGAPFWPSGLTLRSSGPAFCGPLTLAVSIQEAYLMRKFNKKHLTFLLVFSFLISTNTHSRQSPIEGAENAWNDFAICKNKVLKDPELQNKIYQSDRLASKRTEATPIKSSIQLFGEEDTKIMRNTAETRSEFTIYKSASSYEKRPYQERVENLNSCRRLFEFFRN